MADARAFNRARSGLGGDGLMRFTLMQHVVVQTDTLAYGFPIGSDGYMLEIDRRVDQALTYLVRFPAKKENWWVPECDLLDYEESMEMDAEHVISTVMTDYALSIKSRRVFDAYIKKGAFE